MVGLPAEMPHWQGRRYVWHVRSPLAALGAHRRLCCPRSQEKGQSSSSFRGRVEASSKHAVRRSKRPPILRTNTCRSPTVFAGKTQHPFRHAPAPDTCHANRISAANIPSSASDTSHTILRHGSAPAAAHAVLLWSSGRASSGLAFAERPL